MIVGLVTQALLREAVVEDDEFYSRRGENRGLADRRELSFPQVRTRLIPWKKSELPQRS